MNIVDVFSENLVALMSSRPELDSQYKLGSAAGIGPTNIGRFRRGEVAAQIDSVEKVAKAFNLRACDMLDPDLKHRIAAGKDLRMGEPRPPTMSEDEWKSVSPRARALVEDICAASTQKQAQDLDIAWLHDSLQRITKK